VYHLAGQSVNGPCFFVGAFTLANGAITVGNQDYSDSTTSASSTISTTGSSISYASNGNIQLVVATSNQNIGANGVVTVRGTKVSATRVLLSEYDGFAASSGSIDLQTSQAAPSGGYAFLISGVGFDTNNNELATALGGVLNISGTTVSPANSVFDVNFGGQNLSAQSFTAGSVSAPDSLGRFTINLTPATSTGLVGIILAGYIVGPNQIQLVESQDAQGFDLGGMAFAQGTNTGAFSTANLSGKTFVFGSSGIDGNGVFDLAGTFAFGANNVLTGSMAVNDLMVFGVHTVTGSYTVDPTGRATLIGVMLSSITDTLTFQAYLDGNGNALVMGADSVEVTAGPAYLQTSASPTVFGAYGLTSTGFLTDKNGSAWSATGPVTINSGSYSGFTDYNDAGTLTASVSLTGTTSSAGTVSLTGLNGVSLTTANSFATYPVDATRVVSISIDAGLLSLGTLESVKQ
jgi:hypothetical protein